MLLRVNIELYWIGRKTLFKHKVNIFMIMYVLGPRAAEMDIEFGFCTRATEKDIDIVFRPRNIKMDASR